MPAQLSLGTTLPRPEFWRRPFHEHHPGSRFVTLIVDGDQEPIDDAGEPFEVMTPNELGLERDELDRMAGIYNVIELSTALKPSFLKRLLQDGANPVAYFDPDIQIFEPLEDIGRHAAERGIVLTPHVSSPQPAEQAILEVGIYNLGFIAVAQGAERFLDWWAEKLARDCLVAHDVGAFVDQRWVDLVPALFDPYILRDETCNVAHWNLRTRKLEQSNGGFLVNGRPLRFFHFSGFDPHEPHLLSKRLGARPELLMSESPALRSLHDGYARLLLEHGYDASSQEPYRLNTLPNGFELDHRMRRLYRAELVEAEHSGSSEPPNPFSEPDRFVDWLREPADPHGQAARVSRYLRAVWEERPDLQREFNDLRWVHGDRYLEWLANGGAVNAGVPVELQPGEPEGRAPEERPMPVAGVNIAGYLRAELGIGEAARRLTAAVKRAGIPYATLSYDQTSSRQEHPFADAAEGRPIHDVNLICVNAEALPSFAYDAGPHFFAGRYSIGVWWWEVAEFPQWMHGAFEIVDEVWVGSDHIAQAIGAATSKPVRVFHLPIEVPEELEPPVQSDRFVFLFAFDFTSVLERKNPLGLIDAFTRAFAPGEGPQLVIKTINGDARLTQLERLRAAVAGRDDIELRDGYVSSAEMQAMMASCDAYASLHRSEGFGLTMAEAMAYGRPVIATGYSGNLTFMSDENSFLVPYRLTEVPEGCGPYPAGAKWAEPDVEAAAKLMRYVHDHPEEARARGERARQDLREHHSLDSAAAFVSTRLAEIRAAKPALRTLAPQPAAATATEEAARYLVDGPSVPIRAPSPFGPVGVFGRQVPLPAVAAIHRTAARIRARRRSRACRGGGHRPPRGAGDCPSDAGSDEERREGILRRRGTKPEH